MKPFSIDSKLFSDAVTKIGRYDHRYQRQNDFKTIGSLLVTRIFWNFNSREVIIELMLKLLTTEII